MAARGTDSKNAIAEKILETFDGAFKYDKEIRIPMVENGECIQIKVVLTAAKTNVGQGEDTVIPGEVKIQTPEMSASGPVLETFSEPTAEELDRVADLFNSLGL